MFKTVQDSSKRAKAIPEKSRQFKAVQGSSSKPFWIAQGKTVHDGSRRFRTIHDASREAKTVQDVSRHFKTVQKYSRRFKPFQDSSKTVQDSSR
eukprot:7187225-Alexandrium_andersonii.AAC.1